jgi:hypothetical protein
VINTEHVLAWQKNQRNAGRYLPLRLSVALRTVALHKAALPRARYSMTRMLDRKDLDGNFQSAHADLSLCQK